MIAQEQLVVPYPLVRFIPQRQRGSGASIGPRGLRKGIGRLARWLTIAEWTVGRARDDRNDRFRPCNNGDGSGRIVGSTGDTEAVVAVATTLEKCYVGLCLFAFSKLHAFYTLVKFCILQILHSSTHLSC